MSYLSCGSQPQRLNSFCTAASFNPHRIHYDRSYAEYEGHEDIVVHGPLKVLGSLNCHRLGRASGTFGISRVANRVGFVGEELAFSESFNRRNDGSVEIEIEERKKDGSLLMPARATADWAVPVDSRRFSPCGLSGRAGKCWLWPRRSRTSAMTK